MSPTRPPPPTLQLVTDAYDSRRDTQDHINRVRQLIAGFVALGKSRRSR